MIAKEGRGRKEGGEDSRRGGKGEEEQEESEGGNMLRGGISRCSCSSSGRRKIGTRRTRKRRGFELGRVGEGKRRKKEVDRWKKEMKDRYQEQELPE